MKTSLLATLLLGAFVTTMHAVTLTVSPTATSNTYAGVITLQVGGLTNTEAVVIQEYLDLNANGTADASEPMVDTFPIADGGASLIGGITNLNVPFDRNSTTGAITTTLFFAAPLLVENFVGQHIFRVVSPTGRFAAVNTLFNVTNVPAFPALTGQVLLGAAPATNAVVIALNYPSSGFAGGAVADNAGNYSLRLPAGSYIVLATLPDAYMDQSLAPQVTLTNGMTATNNLQLTAGTVAISGMVRDATNAAPLGGVFLLLESANYIEPLFTRSNGTFSALVSPSFWKVDVEEDRMARRGYVTPANKPQSDLSTGAVANVFLDFSQADAMYYGRITNSLGQPLANIRFDGSDGQDGTPQTIKVRGFSDANGYYTVAVLAVTNLLYTSPDTADIALANYIVSQGQSVLFDNEQVFNLDFTALPATATISGQVKDNLGNPVTGVILGANAVIGGLYYGSANVDTDNAGNYSFGVASGLWYVQFSGGGDSLENLANHSLVDLFGPYPVAVPPTNAVQNITVYPTGTPILSSPKLVSPTQISLSVTGSVNTTYTLQVSTNLAGTNWSSQFSFQLTSNPFPIFDSQATNKLRLYRLLKN